MVANQFVEYVRYVWNVIIYENDANLLLSKYPNILKDFNLQKTLLGKNMFDVRGHKSPIKLTWN
jgi:hypothetical protein